MRVAGVVLAGGRSSRFGSEKAVAEWESAPLLARVLDVLAAGCDLLAVNARPGSGAAALAAARDLALLPDPPGAPAGPLTGVLAASDWAAAQGCDLLATAPCDTPRLPPDLVARLMGGLPDGADAAFATAGGRDHPLCAVWRTAAAPVIAEALADGAHPPVRRVMERLRAVAVGFGDADAFANVNTPDDLLVAPPLTPRAARGI